MAAVRDSFSLVTSTLLYALSVIISYLEEKFARKLHLNCDKSNKISKRNVKNKRW